MIGFTSVPKPSILTSTGPAYRLEIGMMDGFPAGRRLEGSAAGDDIAGVKRMKLADETDDFRDLVIIISCVVFSDQLTTCFTVDIQFIRVLYLILRYQPGA